MQTNGQLAECATDIAAGAQHTNISSVGTIEVFLIRFYQWCYIGQRFEDHLKSGIQAAVLQLGRTGQGDAASQCGAVVRGLYYVARVTIIISAPR